MMRRLFPGGLYVDARPGGAREYVVLFPGSRLETHLTGRLSFPDGETFGPMFLDCGDAGEFQFAGLMNRLGRIHVWDSRGWHPRDSVTPAVFDQLGTLIDWPVVLPTGEISARGWRYVDDLNRPVSEQDTYDDPVNGLNQWIEHAGFRLGQAHDRGIRFRDDAGVIRQFGHVDEQGQFIPELGNCNAIKFRVAGELAVVAYYISDAGAVIWRGTLGELRGMPAYQAPAPLPGPAPVPLPPPHPSPTPAPNPSPAHAPAPLPVPQETPRMIAYGQPIAGFVVGEQVSNADGSVSVKKPNGQFLCVTPDGQAEERPAGGGPWESFRRGRNCLIAERDGGRVYVLPIAE